MHILKPCIDLRFSFFFLSFSWMFHIFHDPGKEVCWQEGCVLFFQAGFKYNCRIYQSDLDLTPNPSAILEGEVQQHTCLSPSMQGVSRYTENLFWGCPDTASEKWKWWEKIWALSLTMTWRRKSVTVIQQIQRYPNCPHPTVCSDPIHSSRNTFVELLLSAKYCAQCWPPRDEESDKSLTFWS